MWGQRKIWKLIMAFLFGGQGTDKVCPPKARPFPWVRGKAGPFFAYSGLEFGGYALSLQSFLGKLEPNPQRSNNHFTV